MKKTWGKLILAAVFVLSVTGLSGCSTSVRIPDTVKVQQGDIGKWHRRSKGSSRYGSDSV